MSNETRAALENLFAAVFITCVLLFTGFIIHSSSYESATRVFEEKAVKDGVAEYYLDEHNARRWRWKGDQ